jgi:ATP-dependent 26S proteasome regulatory subunit
VQIRPQIKFKTFLERNDRYVASTAGSVEIMPPGLYAYDMNNDGMHFIPKETPADQIVLDEQQTFVINRLKVFMASREKYQAMRISHKRAFLLYGPPGTGKTTIIRALCSEIEQMGGYSFELRSAGELRYAIQAIREINQAAAPILIFKEDIEDESTILELLDGTMVLDNVLFVFTTNNINDISRRIKNRPSRIDEKILVDWPTLDMRRAYIAAMYPDLSQGMLTELAAVTERISMAHLKEIVIQRTVFNETFDRVNQMADQFRQDCADNGEVYEPNEKKGAALKAHTTFMQKVVNSALGKAFR